MTEIAFYDVKPYDRTFFDAFSTEFGFKLKYIESKLNEDSAVMAEGCGGVVAFVNDSIDKNTVLKLHSLGVRVLALRSAGYNNVDLKAAFGKIHVVRVPAYSPYAVAEHAMSLLLTLNRKTHRAFNRTREHNFALSGLMGFDLHGKTAGVIGTGKIGRVFIDICKGFGMKILAYDPFPIKEADVNYVTLDELYKSSDIISLHCPLTKDTHHIINYEALSLMRDGVYIINTSRGALIDTEALLDAIRNRKVGGVGLDVYEEEEEFFFEDFSDEVLKDDTLLRILSMPNVIVTGHQAFLTREALENIARTTLGNLRDYFDGNTLKNEVCYRCEKRDTCDKSHKEHCF